MLGLPFPGGPHLQRLAQDGDPRPTTFRAPPGCPGLDFSFAGLKTALLYTLRDLDDDGGRAAKGRPRSLLPGGDRRCTRPARDACAGADGPGSPGDRRRSGGERPLRERLSALGAVTHTPAPELCTDNAAMIALAALEEDALDPAGALALEAFATGERGL